MADPLDDCGHCTLSPTVSGEDARAVQATCPVHGTPPYAPRSAPSASSQALPADQDTPHPLVAVTRDALLDAPNHFFTDEPHRAHVSPDGRGGYAAGCPVCKGNVDAMAAAVAPAVLRWAMDRLRQEARIADDPTWNSIGGAVDALKDELTEITRSAR